MKTLDLSDLSFLVVDDSVYMRKLMRTLLAGFGVRSVAEADSADAAIESIRASLPDIVLCDWEMPKRSGISLLDEIRGSRQKELRFMPVIIVSGYSEQSRVQTARDHGANHYLVKPVSAASLYSRIARTVLVEADFVEAGAFFGPDRRFRNEDEYDGEERRGR
ncbi:MAG: response regulator [Pseudomonadota bacterium]